MISHEVSPSQILLLQPTICMDMQPPEHTSWRSAKRCDSCRTGSGAPARIGDGCGGVCDGPSAGDGSVCWEGSVPEALGLAGAYAEQQKLCEKVAE